MKYLLASLLLILSTLTEAAQISYLPLAARTSTIVGSDLTRTQETAVHFVIVVTAVTGGSSITPEIDAKDAAGNSYVLLTGTAITTTGTTVLKLGPGFTPVPNAVASDIVPDIYSMKVTNTGGGSYTYSVNINAERY